MTPYLCEPVFSRLSRGLYFISLYEDACLEQPLR
jgi:hypothetical protein